MNHKEYQNFIIAIPSGKLDTISAPEFSKELLILLEKKPKGCIIDLSAVSFLSSSGLQALLAGAKKAKSSDIKYAVCNMSEMVNDVFTLSGFDRFIKTFNTKDDAINSL
jgi:anti-sigma B factor antagonist